MNPIYLPPFSLPQLFLSLLNGIEAQHHIVVLCSVFLALLHLTKDNQLNAQTTCCWLHKHQNIYILISSLNNSTTLRQIRAFLELTIKKWQRVCTKIEEIFSFNEQYLVRRI